MFGLGADQAWREYRDREELEKAVGMNEVRQKGRFWRTKGGTAAAQMVENPISGDWVQVVEYCFRSDGTLARLESMLTTFDAADDIDIIDGVERFRARYFDSEGREFARREDVRNAKSRQSAKRVFADKTEPAYRTICEMPFAALLTGYCRAK